MWKTVMITVALLVAASACGASIDESQGDPEAACDAAETMLSVEAGQALLDRAGGPESDPYLNLSLARRLEKAHEAFEENAPSDIAAAWRATQEISDLSFRVSERDARDEAVNKVNDWIRTECDLIYGIE